MLHAEIVSVGTELLLGQIVDTHAPVMARILAECGIACTRRATIGDNFDRLTEALAGALERADVLVTIGGLGPTVDDLTRDAIARALGDELVLVPEVEARLKRFFAQRNVPWIESNSKQAMRPESADLIDNPNGTAPGLVCRKNGKIVLALPGPKGEFDPMAYGPVREILSRLEGGAVIHSRTLRICGIGESMVEEQIRDLMDGENPTVAPYAHTGEVHLRLTARAASTGEADRLIDPVEAQIRAILGDAVFGINTTTLEEATINQLIEQNATISVAESMSGGGLGERLTGVAGASKAFVGGAIVYSTAAKETLVGVSPELIQREGPVSVAVAEALAEGIRQKLGTTYGVAITGNAGPTADVDNKPVGLVYVAVAGPSGIVSDESRFRGVREDIRRRGTQTALLLLRRALLQVEKTE